MKNRNFFITLTMMIILICSSSVFSQDWPQFRGIARDSKVTGFKAPQTWPQNLTQIWKVNVGFGDATPVLSGNRIYLTTRQAGDEAILCLDAASGKELWKNTYPAPAVTGPSSSHPGPRTKEKSLPSILQQVLKNGSGQVMGRRMHHHH